MNAEPQQTARRSTRDLHNTAWNRELTPDSGVPFHKADPRLYIEHPQLVTDFIGENLWDVHRSIVEALYSAACILETNKNSPLALAYRNVRIECESVLRETYSFDAERHTDRFPGNHTAFLGVSPDFQKALLAHRSNGSHKPVKLSA